MQILIIIALIIVLILFGISSSAASYASAQQAQAQIEAARAAQISAGGNVLALLILGGLIVLIVLALILVALVWIRRSSQGGRTGQISRRPGASQVRAPADDQAPAIDMNQINALIALKVLETLGRDRPALPAPDPRDQHPDDPLHWLH